MPDARQLVIHLLLLEAQLLFVGQVLPFASATNAEMLATGCLANLAVFAESDDFGFGVAMLLVTDLQVDHIAWNAKRHKHHQLALGRSVVGGNGDAHERLAFGSHIGDGDILEYG